MNAMLAAYPPLPQPPDRDPAEPALYYGTRLFTWIVVTGVHATCTDEQLELALHSSMYAVTGPRSTPATDDQPAREGMADAALETLQEARLQLARTCKRRQQERAAAAAQPAQPPDDNADGNRPSRLIPPPKSPIGPTPTERLKEVF